jgi:type VI secretion system protein ImpJ
VLGVAHVVECRSDNQVLLDRSYIPPQTRLDADDALSGHARLVHGLISQRAQELAGRMGQLSHGVSELTNFLMLQVLNRVEPVFRQHADAPNVHPLALFLEFLQLAGELSTFTTQSRRPVEFPRYRPDDLRGCFTPLVQEIRKLLSVVREQNSQQFELVDRKHGVRTAVINDLELVRSSSFVLAVNAQLPPEQLRQRFVAQTKIGPVDRIRDLVNLQLPGIGLQSLPVAPRQLPFHAGHFYFEMERGGDLWRQFEKSGSLALHIAGDFPGLELELWAIRQ